MNNAFRRMQAPQRWSKLWRQSSVSISQVEVVGRGTHVVEAHPTAVEDELEEEVVAMHKIEDNLKNEDLLEERHISSVIVASNMDIMQMNVHIKTVSMSTWQNQVEMMVRNSQSY